MQRYPAKLKRAGLEDGFMLLETIVALAISSSLVLLLVATLNGLSRSQERINSAVQAMNADIYDDVFVRSLFAGIRPSFIDDAAKFEGTRYKIVARSYVTDWSPPEGDGFTLELEPGSGGTATLTLRGRTQPLPGLGPGDYRLQYVDHFGRVSDTWASEARDMVDNEVQRLAAYTAPVPRQVRIVRRIGSDTEIIFALDVSAFDWPPPRPQDSVLLAGAL